MVHESQHLQKRVNTGCAAIDIDITIKGLPKMIENTQAWNESVTIKSASRNPASHCSTVLAGVPAGAIVENGSLSSLSESVSMALADCSEGSSIYVISPLLRVTGPVALSMS